MSNKSLIGFKAWKSKPQSLAKTQYGHAPQDLRRKQPDMGVWYCTREDVKSALDYKETARVNAAVDRAIEAASRSVEGLLHGKFYPEIATRYFDWPNYQRARSWRLWLYENELISASSLVSGGTTISASDYFLEPINSGPPYNRVEIDLSSSNSFDTGSTSQRSIAITGTYGYDDVTTQTGTAAEAMDASETGFDVSNVSLIGVGSIVKIDSERMIVTEKQMLTSGQTLQGNLTASNAGTSVSVTDGTGFAVGEVILVDSERMQIVDIAGNSLIVKRAQDGSTLAAHSSGATIYAPRTLVVSRGALGTTAATHSQGTAIYVQVIHPLVRSLAIAEALNQLLQEQSGYARVAGSGENAEEFRGRGLQGLREQAYTAVGRKARTGAI